MIAADKFGPKNPKVTTLDQITYRQAFTVGLVQCLSLWPGFSRSGATISGGVLFGMNHKTAADFTFIMAVPIMMGASLVSVLKNWEIYRWMTYRFTLLDSLVPSSLRLFRFASS